MKVFLNDFSIIQNLFLQIILFLLPRFGRIADVADTRQAYRGQSQHVRRPRHQQRMDGDGPYGVVRQYAHAIQPDTAADPVHHPADDGHGNHDHGADHPVPPGDRRRCGGDRPGSRFAHRERVLDADPLRRRIRRDDDYPGAYPQLQVEPYERITQ